MQLYKPNIFFNHIPKARGTTVYEVISRGYDEDKILHADIHAREIMLAPLSNLKKINFISGHYGHHVLKFFPGEYFKVVTLVDPWKRFNSFLKHVARDQNFAKTLFLFDKQGKLKSDFFNNQFIQTYWMSSYLCYLQHNWSSLPSKENFEASIETLHKYDMVITEDNYDIALNHLSLLVGMPPYESPPHFNKGINKSFNIADIEEQFRETFSYEFEIYKEAKRISHEQRPAFVNKFGSNYSENNGYYLDKLRNEVADELDIDWSKSIRCNGWSGRNIPGLERYQDNFGRLIVNSDAFIDICLDTKHKSEFRGRFVIWSSNPEVANEIKITLNNKHIECDTIFPEQNKHMFVITCGLSLEDYGSVQRLGFHIDQNTLDKSEVWLMLGGLY